MDKKLVRKLHIIGGIVLIVLLGLTLWYSGFDYEGVTHDEKVFKSSYEALNLEKNEDNKNYLSVKINKDNKIKYISVDEAINKLSKGTSIIFMGSPDDDLTRAYVETIVDTVAVSKLDTLYYLEVSYKDQNTYSKLVKAIGEETLVLPRIDAIKNGEVIGVIENIPLENEDITKGLNDTEKNNLKDALNNLIDDTLKEANVCNEGC